MAEPLRIVQSVIPAGPDLAMLINRFAELCDAAPDERALWLDDLEQRDPAAAQMLRRMLEAEASGQAQTLDTPLLDLDAELIDGHATIDAMPSHAPGLGGRYEVLRPLGFGANGDVYLARQRYPVEREVAIKVLRPSQVRPSTVERMAREAKALATLSHPNIATVFEAGQADDGRPFIATEYVAGEPIDAWCTATGASARVRILTLARVCRAVEHMHQRGVIHRDLKPTNILVAGRLEDPCPKVLDLGIARIIGDGEQAAPTLTQPGALLGSLGYIAPEQFKGAPADTRSDIFALGRVLERLLKDVSDPWTSRHARDLAAVIRMATEAEPIRRYGSAGSFAEDLESLLLGRSISAWQASAGEALARLVRRHPRMFIFSALGTLVVAVATGLAAERTFSEARASRDRSRVVTLQKELLTTTLDKSVRILARYAGTIEQRTEMAGQLDQQITAMMALDPADRDLRALRARVQMEQARIAQAQAQFARAEVLAASASSTLQDLIDPSVDSVNRLRQLALAIIVHGDCLSQLGQHQRAEDRYREAMAIHRLGHQRFPRSVEMLDDLCWSLDRFSQPLTWAFPRANVDREPWMSYAAERLVLAELLLGMDPQRVLSRYNLAVAHLKAGRTWITLDDDRARNHLQIARDGLAALQAQDPERSSIRDSLVTTHVVLAEHYRKVQPPELAIAEQEVAVGLLRSGLQARPRGDVFYIDHLLAQADTLARWYRDAGRFEDADFLLANVQRAVQDHGSR